MLEGHILNDRYQIKKTIGGGGMANVYLAHDIILDRDVAIKALRFEFANDPEFIERFDREAQAATSLSHPNIVNIYDVGEDDHILYMAMEYIDGMTLKEYIQENGPVPVEEAIEIMKQLTDAITHAHANGLIHRDIKPQNVLVDRYGNIKITDFGIAIALSATSLTQTNAVLGSVHYLSPEQARGGMATKKSDIYALGIVLYELLTGKLPFSGQTPISIALKHLQNDTPSVRSMQPNIPQSVENIVLKATTKDPLHRYHSAYEMEEALSVALDPENLNEPIYEPPVEDGEATKAIPVITNDQITSVDAQATTKVHYQEDDLQKSNTAQAVTTDGQEVGGKPKPKKRKKLRNILIVLAILLFIGFGGIIAIILLSSPKEVEIPDVAGMEYDQAKEELEALKLRVVKQDMFAEDVEEGIVIKTDPQAERSVKTDAEVNVFVSQGKEKMPFDNYVGQKLSQVENILSERGYQTIRSYDKESDEPAGTIITQIQPQPDEEVVPSETTVIFEISGGPKMTSLGNLRGLTVDEAKDYAAKHDLKLSISEDYSDTAEKGIVISQDPSPNSDVTAGDTIKVTVSLGAKELPPKAHKVTFTVPFKPKELEDGEYETEQTVQIYVDDMNESISDVFHEEKITSDQEYTLTLVIEPNKTAQYRVVRDGDVFLDKKIDYKE